MESSNIYRDIQKRIKDACDALGVEQEVYEILKQPKRVVNVAVPVRMDDGSVRVFQGIRSQHNDALGPIKGGLRFHPEVGLGEVCALSMMTTIKCSVMGLPCGGGKGAIRCNPKEMSTGELERLCRAFVHEIAPIIGPEKDVTAPDVYTNSQIMIWIADEFSKIEGCNVFNTVTGKPVIIGGCLGRSTATAKGCSYVVAEAARRIGLDIKGARVAISGFGNTGGVTAKVLTDLGARIVGCGDSKGAVYNSGGIDIDALDEYRYKAKTVKGFPGSGSIPSGELLTCDCDILIPAALENQITRDNAGSIKAKIIGEAADRPTTPEADLILANNGVMVIPDILASAGGVTVSYFEWVQNQVSFYWTKEEVDKRLRNTMVKAFDAVYDMHNSKQVNMRIAAYMVAVDRVAQAMRVRGWLK